MIDYLQKLKNACLGLTYQSESDERLEPIELRLPPYGTPANFDQTIASIDGDTAELKEIFNSLKDCQVIRYGEIRVAIYCIGSYNGRWYGFKTISVET